MFTQLLRAYQSVSLGLRILIGLLIGGGLGYFVGEPAMVVAPVGKLFINLLMMGAVPLVFFNVVAAITKLSELKTLGKLGISTMGFYVGTTGAALACGLFMANILRPGVGVEFSEEAPAEIGTAPDMVEVIVGLVPSNVVAAFSSGNVAQVVVFGVLLGVAALFMPDERRNRIHAGVDVVADWLRQLIELILETGPIGIAALAAATFGEHGQSVAGPLGKFILAVWLAQAIMVCFYMTVLYAATGRSPLAWLKTTATLYATTSATCSSLASLVVSMDIARNKLKLPEKIYGFTLPIGAQLNKDGTSIMLAVVLLFTGQAVDIEFDMATQFQILFIGLILSEGSTGIPGGGLVIAFIFVKAFNLPLEAAAMVAGIYRLIDMGSTTINCMGDMVWTTIASDRLSLKQPELVGSTPAIEDTHSNSEDLPKSSSFDLADVTPRN